MAELYARMVASGRMALAGVPARWRAEAERLLGGEQPLGRRA